MAIAEFVSFCEAGAPVVGGGTSMSPLGAQKAAPAAAEAVCAHMKPAATPECNVLIHKVACRVNTGSHAWRTLSVNLDEK